MNNRSLLPLLTLLLLLLASCDGAKKENTTDSVATEADAVTVADTLIRHAEGLRITPGADGVTLVEISDPTKPGSEVYRYALVSRERQETPALPDGYTVIPTPVRRVIVMTTLQLSNFIKLDAVDRVVGMPSTHFLFNEKMLARLRQGDARRIGIEGNFDTELIMALQPDLILVSPFKRGGYDALRNLGIPLVTFLGYKETSPLGQAEWIKFTALLLGLETEAETTFDGIEERYRRLQRLITPDLPRPKILSGELHGGNWYVVGGESYLAHLFRDAGGDYFLADNGESGGFYLDFETVYSRAADADFWRITNNYKGDYSYDVLAKTDARYADFAAFRERHVVYCNLSERAFYEGSPVEPDVVLADLIHAFHPELLPDHRPVYYDLLRRVK